MIQIYFTIHFKKQPVLQHIHNLIKMTFKNRRLTNPIIFEIVDDFVDNNNDNEDDYDTNNDDKYKRHEQLSDDDIEIVENIKARMQEGALPATIYRFKFTEEFMEELHDFSKIHQYDHRKDFKEAWTIWLENNEYLVETEIRRLKNFGYIGDIRDKMFKSARYYLRKKSTEKKAPAERRNYVAVQKELLDAIDTHIKNIISRDSKPSDGFDDFCKNNKDILNEEIKSLCKNGLTDSTEIKNKIKKTYKNRHFLIVSK